MRGYCPSCDRLVTILPAPKDAVGRPRKRVIEHDWPLLDGGGRCPGSSKLI